MDQDERTLWDKKYRDKSHASLQPDPLLASAYSEFLTGQPPGEALDVAGGAGRHALWLAQRGWRVKLVDLSETGIAQAKANARTRLEHGGRPASVSSELIEAGQMDLQGVQDLGQERYDLVLVFFYLQRELFPAIRAALKPGGLLIYKTYTTQQLLLGSGPSNPCYLLMPGELQQAFQSMRVLHYRENVASVATAELVAQKLPNA
jgi:SAM-dependent methyltransferase